MLHQTIRILGHLKEIGILASLLHRSSAVRTFSVHKLGIGPEGLAGGTVPTLVFSLINVPVLVHLSEHLLHLLFVIFLCCTHELIIGGIHQIPNGMDFSHHLVHELLGSLSRILGLPLDFLTMLIGSGHEKYIIALVTLEAGNGISQDNLIGIPDMGLS